MDAIAQFKEMQSKVWAGFAPVEVSNGTAAPKLVKHARVRAGSAVLDVACGTGVVALAAARAGARVTGLDITPELVAHAKENAELARLTATFVLGDAEVLPFEDASFDVVLSQFGHIFAPRPDVVTKEMLRVLKPGGTIAFSTWPVELFIGRFFALVGQYAPPPLPGVSPPVQWGDVAVIRERLGAAVKDIVFARDAIKFQVLSPGHMRLWFEKNIGPLTKLIATLASQSPDTLATLRREIEELSGLYFDENVTPMDFLMTRATKI
jgi:SAM-dependent methyltransferase